MRFFRPSFLLGTFILICFALRSQPYHNLALEGGGIRGVAYAGSIQELEDRGVMDDIQNVAGSSVGAIGGCLISVGYSGEELRKILSGLSMQQFNDGKWFFLGGQSRLRNEYGWYRGDALEKWVEEAIFQKTGQRNLTFRQLHELKLKDRKFRDLYVAASNISRQKLVVFSWQDYPDMVIATAVRASASIPIYFRAMQLDSLGRKSETGDYIVDGGLLMNFPITLFDSGKINSHTLGLKLERPEQIPYSLNDPGIAPYEVNDLKSFMGALYNLTMESLNRKTSMEDERHRTIYISTQGVPPRIRSMNKAQKSMLYESGRKGAKAFFDKQAHIEALKNERK